MATDRMRPLDEAHAVDADVVKSVSQKRSNSIPIATNSLSGRLSQLRNTLSPLSITPTKMANTVPSLQLSPSSSPSSSKKAGMLPVGDFIDGSASSSSSSSTEANHSPRSSKLHTLLKTLSINGMSDVGYDIGIRGRSPSTGEQSQVQNQNDVGWHSFEQNNFIPPDLIDPGVELLRITRRKKIKRCFQIDPEKNILKWNNKPSSFLRIDKIRNIRVGAEAKNYREEFKISSGYQDLWITIIYFNDSISNNIKALHILATRKYDFEMFLSTLKLLVFVNRDLAKNISLGPDNDLFTNFHWNNYVMNESKFNEKIVDPPHTKTSQTLDAEGVLKLAKRLNINIDSEHLLRLFKKCDLDSNGYLDFEEFKTFVALLRTRLEISALFKELTNSDYMTFEQFESFLVDVQQEDYDSSFIWKLFQKVSSSGSYLSLEDFQNFLKSSYTSPFMQIEEDYSKPINDYYISSSHNTYLLGRQVGGDSSVEGYIRFLQRGCRCIEIDLWDGQLENGEKGPTVKHGRSFTTSVNFKEVLVAVRKYAFISTPFPLIISLEIHCNAENQVIIKNLLCEILGEMLVLQPLMTNSLILPTPKELKHKILIKVKKTESSGSSSFGSGASSTSVSTTSASSFSEDNLSLTQTPKKSFISRARGTTKINPDLSALGVYLSALKFRNFSLPESKTFNHCFSFSEKAVNKMLKDPVKLQSLLKHNKRYLMRLYPSKYRYNSTNFDPIPFWAVGVQMVATNWQMFDLGQQLNESMFLVGSKSGYVLKPAPLRTLSKFEEWVPKKSKINFTIHIISGQQLPAPTDHTDTISPYVEFECYGFSSTTYSNEVQRTKIVKSNGFNPIWEDVFEREIITTTPSLVFVRLLIKCATVSDSNPLLGVCVLKLTSLKKGYRHLTIYDLQGEEFIFSKLFVKVDYGMESI